MSRGRPWSADDAARLRRLVAAGETDARIAEAMDRHPDMIRRQRRDIQRRQDCGILGLYGSHLL